MLLMAGPAMGVACGAYAGDATLSISAPNNANWNTPSVWMPATVPVNGDNALVTAFGTAKTLNFNGSYSSPGLNQLRIYSSVSSATMWLSQATANSMLAMTEYVGYSGAGAYVQTAGTNTVTGDAYVGYTSGTTGSYSLSSSGIFAVTGTEYVGYTASGAGTITQGGGTNTIGSALLVGYGSGTSNGSYILSGGNLETTGTGGWEVVGYNGTGNFVHSAGANSSKVLELGYGSSGQGSYTLSGSGSVSMSQWEEVGYQGHGTFTQSGGTNTTPYLDIGESTSGNAYVLSGSGNLTVTSEESLGSSGGSGTFTQSGGTHSIGFQLRVGPTSAFKLNGGILMGNWFENEGNFTQSAGTLTLGHCYVSGNCSVTGGTFSGTGGIDVGWNGNVTRPGTFTFSSGTLSAPTLRVYKGSVFHRSGGSLNVQSLILTGRGKMDVAKRASSGGLNRPLYLNSLSIDSAGGSKLDLNDNDLVVNNGSFSAVQALVLQGYSSSPDSTKTGIISTTSQTVHGGTTILALFDNSMAGFSDYPFGSGQTISASAIVGKYTYIGDTNYDGQVTPQDYAATDANLNTSVDPAISWFYGDTNFDGNIDSSDYTGIDAALGLGVGNPLAMHAMAVPEVGVGWGIGVGLLGMRRRRRR